MVPPCVVLSWLDRSCDGRPLISGSTSPTGDASQRNSAVSQMDWIDEREPSYACDQEYSGADVLVDDRELLTGSDAVRMHHNAQVPRTRMNVRRRGGA